MPVRASKMLALPFAESLTSQMLADSDNCEQITQRILLSIKFENLQPGVFGCSPIALGIVTNMQYLVRRKTAYLGGELKNQWIRFIGAEFAREKNVPEIFGNSKMLEDHPQPAVEI